MGSNVPPMTPRRVPTTAILRPFFCAAGEGGGSGAVPAEPTAESLPMHAAVDRARFLKPRPRFRRDLRELAPLLHHPRSRGVKLGAHGRDVERSRDLEPLRVLLVCGLVGELVVLVERAHADLFEPRTALGEPRSNVKHHVFRGPALRRHPRLLESSVRNGVKETVEVLPGRFLVCKKTLNVHRRPHAARSSAPTARPAR